MTPSALIVRDGLEDAGDQHGGQAQRRLVEHEQRAGGHERAADRAHLLLAARQRAGELALRSSSTGKSE